MLALKLLRQPAAMRPLSALRVAPAWTAIRFFSATPQPEVPNGRRVRRLLRDRKRQAADRKKEAEEKKSAAGYTGVWHEFRRNFEKNAQAEKDRHDEQLRQAANKDSRKPENEGKRDDEKPDGSRRNVPPGKKIVDVEINLTQLLWVVLATMFVFSLISSTDAVPEITFQEFKTNMLDRGEVAKLQVVNKAMVRVFTRNSGEHAVAYFTIGSVDAFERHLAGSQDALGINPEDRVSVNYVEEGSWVSGLFGLLPTLLFLGFLVWIGRRTAARATGSKGGVGGMFGVGKTKAQLYDPQKDVKVRFSDVAGMDEAKTEIMEFVQFLKTPAKYERLGAKIPRGAILSGAPGTGKTLLAKATAGEAGVPFFSVSGSEFVEMFSGVGASRVRDLFKKAKERAPSMIWIDEIDAIGKARAGAGIRGGNDEREATLNQLLVEMDGFASDQHVVVLAGTNRVDMLDKALLRPGRFDRHINIDLPTLEGRREIYDVHLRDIKYDHTIPELSGKLAAMTPGFSGADIANCCNEAALAAARDNASEVKLVHFEQAVDRVIAGLERRSRVLPKNKREIVAHHEAGHAVAGWFLPHADPLVKVTIVPHGAAALGYAQLLPSDATITTEDRMRDLITVALGGRCSEEIFYETVTVGASDDFKRITQIARGMVTDYGFSSKLGAVRLERPQGAVQKGYSEKTDELIDEEVHRIIGDAHERCKQLLTEKKELVAKVAEELIAKEQLTRKDLVRILGERPFRDNEHEAFRKYLDVN